MLQGPPPAGGAGPLPVNLVFAVTESRSPNQRLERPQQAGLTARNTAPAPLSRYPLARLGEA